ncbi:condensation domain-containing protein, partial [Pseudomonas mosselii]|uniref:condensation domain-containing protein n=2 Tax=Pseudomonas mosselii TaxID=78327 RepID=UPI003D27D41F
MAICNQLILSRLFLTMTQTAFYGDLHVATGRWMVNRMELGSKDDGAQKDQRSAAERILAKHIESAKKPIVEDAVPTYDNSTLSYGQARMWFLHLMDPTSPAYNIFSIARLHGQVDMATLRQALQALVDKHPSLRTSFQTDATGLPEAVLHCSATANLSVIDQAASPRKCLEDFIWQPFDLGIAPLLKAVVIRESDDTCLIALVMHHIIADGWSLGILHKDLQHAYTAAQAQDVDRAAANVDFSTFVAAEKQWIASKEGERSRQYWRQQLSDLSHIELPMAKSRPAIANFRGKQLDLTLPLALVQALETFAAHHECSLYMVLGAALKVLLHRYSGQTDIVFGTPVANRPTEDLEHVLGLFVNTVMAGLEQLNALRSYMAEL